MVREIKVVDVYIEAEQEQEQEQTTSIVEVTPEMETESVDTSVLWEETPNSKNNPLTKSSRTRSPKVNEC